jgi:uracil-DNA glycosylase
MKDSSPVREQLLEHLRFYKDLGVRWVGGSSVTKKPISRSEKKAAAPSFPKTGTPAARVHARSSMFDQIPGKEESLEDIRADLKDCKRCKLWTGRKNVVYGHGDPDADLMFVGEAPGADEDEQGLPFVGRAGQLLTKIIESIELNREKVFICNILKCRPPGNRNPETDEIASCEQFLFRQIAAIRPKVICALGTFGAQTLLRTTEPISRLRGTLIDYRGAKLMATFHPAYLLRNPNEKRKVWEDMLVIRNYLRSLKQP